MAEHVRNELARAGVPVRPERILTLNKFLEPFTPFKEAPESLLYLLIAQRNFSEFPGYNRALVSLIQEGAFTDLAAEIDDQLEPLGFALRPKRLRTAEPANTGPVFIDGFFTLSPGEREFLEKLKVVQDAEQPSDQQLNLFTTARQSTFAALSLDQEVEEIARRILAYAAEGREFREMAIILRSRDPYASALETTLARFGIPARFHFPDALSAHPAIQYLTGVVRTLLGGWDNEQLLTYLRMPVSGLANDHLDFAIRDSLPAYGLQNIERLCEAANAFRPLSELAHARLTPLDWSARLKSLRKLLPTPDVTDNIDRDQLYIWRSTTASLEGFANALDITALSLPAAAKLPLADFWPHAESAIAIEKLRVPDRRRNVVNVLDAYEARQWQVPIVFVCGLTERNFPQYHRENPLLNDAARKHAGLTTSADRQLEERLLFDMAITRATEETILSYARYNDKGDAQLRSFFLTAEGEPIIPTRIVPNSNATFVQVEQALTISLRSQHSRLSPSSIESFLQCPFQFFARKTLRLRERPAKPRDRLDVLLQGTIIHAAIAENELDRVFDAECRRRNIPDTYRTEAVRLELLRHFENFQANREWTLDWPARNEEQFRMALTPELTISGRIDRLLIGPDNQAIVIDYKYSPAAKVKERLEAPIQGGLYLSAAQRAFDLKPVGMFYCGLRQTVCWEGWHTAVPGLEAMGESRTPAGLRELVEEAEQQAIETFETIASGSVEVRPADTAKCRYCDFRDICRVESMPQVIGAGS